MKKTVLAFIIINFSSLLEGQAQALPTEVLLQPVHAFNDDILRPMLINNDQNAIMRGRIEGPVYETDIYILIRPITNTIITIQYDIPLTSSTPGSSSMGANSTIIRPKKPGADGGKLITDTKILAQELKLFPNPIQNEININSAHCKIIHYTIYDQLGRNLIEKKLTPSNNIIINSEDLKKGNYFLKVELEDNKFQTLKFIKN